MVANNRSLNRLPNIEGLLSYRSDDGRLYWKGKTQWKALGSRKEVLMF